MKKSILILIIFMLLIGCNKRNEEINQDKNITIEENKTFEENKTKEEEKPVVIIMKNETIEMKNETIVKDNKVEFSGKEEKKSSNSAMLELLHKKGTEIYKNKSYTKYEKRNEAYFISLKKLKSDFNYDISSFKGDDGTFCDIENSGIYFDVDNKMGVGFTGDTPPVIPMLIGCSKDELYNNQKK